MVASEQLVASDRPIITTDRVAEFSKGSVCLSLVCFCFVFFPTIRPLLRTVMTFMSEQEGATNDSPNDKHPVLIGISPVKLNGGFT